MNFHMPDVCSLCVGPPVDWWKVDDLRRKGERYEGSQDFAERRGNEITRLNLSGSGEPLMAPVCLRCRKQLKRYQLLRVTIGVFFILAASVVCFVSESYQGLGWAWLAVSYLAANSKVLSRRPILNSLRMVPAEFREWDIPDKEAGQMGCSVKDGRLMVPTKIGIVYGDRIPVFTNPEYQRLFNLKNGIVSGYGVPQSAQGSIYGVGLNQLRK